MKANIKLLINCVVLAMLSACSNNSLTIPNQMEVQFSTAVPVTNMNQILELKIDGSERTFSSGSRLRVMIQNKSDNYIVFNENAFITLFVFSDGEWVEIQNEITYSGSIVLSPQGTPLLDSQYTLVKPSLEGVITDHAQKELPLRMVVIGEIMKNDAQTGEKVGAYVDAYMRP